MLALVTGANGFIGSHICEALLAKGHEVRGMVRKTSDLTWIRGLNMELVCGDVRDSGSIDKAVDGTDWVFHAAATVRPKDPNDYEQVNYVGAKTMAESCIKAGVKRFVFLSSAAAAGPAVGTMFPTTEEQECEPVSRYGRGKLKAEEAVVELRDRLHSVVVRYPAVYGPRDRDSLVLLRNLKRGVRPVFGGTFSVVHVKDAAQAAVLAAESDVESGSVYFISDGGCYTYDEMAQVAEKTMGARTVRVRLPNWAVKAAGQVSEWFSREGAIFNRDKADELTQECWVCSPAKARKELGFRPKYDLELGLAETIAWYQERRWL
jgi:nucleoside-diphosphate-sugar epimerase